MPRTYDQSVDEEALFARIQSFAGGMDEFSRATLLPPDVSQRNVNMLADDKGEIFTRPGADALGGTTFGSRINTLAWYSDGTNKKLYAGVGATLRCWDGASWTNVAGYPFGANSVLAMAQGINMLHVSDGSGHLYTYDGAAWVDLGAGSPNPPAGIILLCWHAQRMFAVAGAARDTVIATELRDTASGKWDNTKWEFRPGAGEGQDIVGMISHRRFYLVVAKESSMYMVDANPTGANAAAWPIYTLAQNVGLVAKAAMLSYADNVWFLAHDGIRVIQPTQGIEVPYEVGAPVSLPMQPYIDRINWTSASTSVAWKYRHLLFFAVPLDSATDPNYVLVMNARTGKWMGYWTGWTPTAATTTRFSGVERMVFGDSAGKVNLWKDYLSSSLDSTFLDNGSAIPSLWRSRAFDFQETENLKDGTWCEMRYDGSTGLVTFRVYLDGAVARVWTDSLAQTSNSLPLSLPFDLAVIKPKAVPHSLDGLPEFKEVFFEVESASKRIAIKETAVSAFLSALSHE